MIRTFLVIYGFFTSGHLAYRVLMTLSYLYLFHRTMGQMALLLSLQQICNMVFEIPTGVIGDALGRKHVYLISMGLYTCGSLLIAAAALHPTFMVPGLIAITMIHPLAWAFKSGSLEAWLTHNLKLKNFSGEFHTIFASQAMIRNGWGIVLGPVTVTAFYFWPALPWLIAAACFALTGVALWRFTRDAGDYEVKRYEGKFFTSFFKRACDIVGTSVRALRAYPLLRAWLAVSMGSYLFFYLTIRYHPVWFDRYPDLFSFGRFSITKAELISSCSFILGVAGFVGSWIAKRISVRRSHETWVIAGFTAVASLPSLYFFLPVSLRLTEMSVYLFILYMIATTLGGYVLFVIAEGQFSHSIADDTTRNTLHSVLGLSNEGFIGIFLLVTLATGVGNNVQRLLQLAPFVSIALMAYALRTMHVHYRAPSASTSSRKIVRGNPGPP